MTSTLTRLADRLLEQHRLAESPLDERKDIVVLILEAIRGADMGFSERQCLLLHEDIDAILKDNDDD